MVTSPSFKHIVLYDTRPDVDTSHVSFNEEKMMCEMFFSLEYKNVYYVSSFVVERADSLEECNEMYAYYAETMSWEFYVHDIFGVYSVDEMVEIRELDAEKYLLVLIVYLLGFLIMYCLRSVCCF